MANQRLSIGLIAVLTSRDRALLLKSPWFAVDEVIHDDHIVLTIIIRSWRHVAASNADTCDASVVEHDPKERKAPIGANNTTTAPATPFKCC